MFKVGDRVYCNNERAVGLVTSIDDPLDNYGDDFPIQVTFSGGLRVYYTMEGFEFHDEKRLFIRHISPLEEVLD